MIRTRVGMRATTCAVAALVATSALLVQSSGAARADVPRSTTASAASCTAAEKKRRIAALLRFKRRMEAQRRAYFRTHRNSRARKAFVRKQRAELKRLERRARCALTGPPRKDPPEQQPPPTPTQADLSVSVAPSSSQPGVIGGVMRWEITVRNAGPARAVGVVLEDVLDSSTTLVRTVMTGGCTGTTTLTCPLRALDPGASTTVRIDVRPTRTGTVTNAAKVSTSTPDPVSANNHASGAHSITPLAIAHHSSPERVAQGSKLTYTIVAKNSSSEPVNGVSITQTIPAGVRFLWVRAGTGECGGTQIVTCTFPTLQPGQSVHAWIKLRVREPGQITHTASVIWAPPGHAAVESVTSTTTQVEPAPLPPPSTGPACAPMLSSPGQTTAPNEGVPTDYATFLRPNGEIKVATMLVDFDEHRASRPVSQVPWLPTPTPNEWYAEASYGRTAITLAPPPESWLRLRGSPYSYVHDARALLADAVA
ncbi:MAG: DUF11 domain-containing protein, partial [Actinomycetota bacterium]|nr:DUF11 domain-containing protein [Actinomycetota bacterium]